MIETYALSLPVFPFLHLPPSPFPLPPSLPKPRLELTLISAGGENRYKDKASYEVHHNSEDFKSLVGAVQKEDLLAKGLEIMYLEPIGGFASRL